MNPLKRLSGGHSKKGATRLLSPQPNAERHVLPKNLKPLSWFKLNTPFPFQATHPPFLCFLSPKLTRTQSQFKPNQHIYVFSTVTGVHYGPFRISRVSWDPQAKAFRYTFKYDEGPNSPEMPGAGDRVEMWIWGHQIRTVADVEEEERNGGVMVKKEDYFNWKKGADGSTSEPSFGYQKVKEAEEESTRLAEGWVL